MCSCIMNVFCCFPNIDKQQEQNRKYSVSHAQVREKVDLVAMIVINVKSGSPKTMPRILQIKAESDRLDRDVNDQALEGV